MAIVIQAVYQDGVLKPAEPLPLKDNEKVRITLETALDRVRATYGLLGWKGDAETLRRIALDPEFDPQERS